MIYTITRDNEDLFTTEFLIINEENINWDALSGFPRRSFSLPEIRMFRKRIKWSMYLFTHEFKNDTEIEFASKYFDENAFALLSQYELSKHTISLFADKLNWTGLFMKYCHDEDFLFEYIDHWKEIPVEFLIFVVKENPYIDLGSGKFNRLSLYLKLKD